MTPWRWLGAVTALALLGIVAGVVVVLTSLDAIVERQIEAHGSRITGTRVALDGVDIDLGEGRGTLRGLRVANPPGFSRKQAIEIASIELEIDLASLTDSPLRVERVAVGEAELWFELDEERRTNLDTLRERVASQPAEDPAEAGGEGDALRLRVARIELAGGRVGTQGPHTGGEESVVEFSGLTLRDVGGREGVPPGGVGKEFLLALTSHVMGAVARAELLEVLDEKLGDATHEASKAADGLLRRVFD